MTEERNPLLNELFAGLYPKNNQKQQNNSQEPTPAQPQTSNQQTNQSQAPTQQTNKSINEIPLPNPSQESKAAINIDPAQKEEIKRVIDELKLKMTEIDKIIEELKKKDEKSKSLPKKTEMLLTEIKVPSLELLQ